MVGRWARRRQGAGHGGERAGAGAQATSSRRGGTGVRELGARRRTGQAGSGCAAGRGSGAQAAAGRRAGRHGVGARGARPGRASARRLGVLAGSAGLVWCTVHLAQL